MLGPRGVIQNSKLDKFLLNWKGGFAINSQGYKLIKVYTHPNRNKDNYIREHILVVEKYLGRYLKPHETVHHINENKLDNRSENLYLFPFPSAHDKYHTDPNSIPITKSNLSRFK